MKKRMPARDSAPLYARLLVNNYIEKCAVLRSSDDPDFRMTLLTPQATNYLAFIKREAKYASPQSRNWCYALAVKAIMGEA